MSHQGNDQFERKRMKYNAHLLKGILLILGSVRFLLEPLGIILVLLGGMVLLLQVLPPGRMYWKIYES